MVAYARDKCTFFVEQNRLTKVGAFVILCLCFEGVADAQSAERQPTIPTFHGPARFTVRLIAAFCRAMREFTKMYGVKRRTFFVLEVFYDKSGYFICRGACSAD